MWREGFVPGGRTRFFVRALGHGDDLALLLHGFPETGATWRRVAPLLADAGWRVACPDLKGLGRSEKPVTGYDPETLADEISQLIRNLHARRALLVGHDFGGAVALATAFRHPGRVRALVLASSPYRQLDLRRSWHIPLLNLPAAPELAFRYGSRRIVRAALHHAAEVTEGFTDEVIDEYAAGVAERPRAWLAYYRALSRRAFVEWGARRLRRRFSMLPDPGRPHRLRVPTVVVWGAQDPVTPVELGARVAFDLDAPLVTVPDAGHFLPEEDPLTLARVILGHARAVAAGEPEPEDASGTDPEAPAPTVAEASA